MRTLRPWIRCGAAVPLLALLLAGCGNSGVPDPRSAAQAYAEAVEQGEPARVQALLSREAQDRLGAEGTGRALGDCRSELRARAAEFRKAPREVKVQVTLAFDDGEVVSLVAEEGQLRLAAAGALPAGARSPAGALAELRRALARRSYHALSGVLTSESREQLEGTLRSLVQGLEHPETLEVQSKGDDATVTVPGGHTVRLKRESGVWRVEDFD